MKGTTSEWFETLSHRARKDLINLLFDVEAKVRKDFRYDLFMAFLRCIDDEYHALKKRASTATAPSCWERLVRPNL